MDRRRSRLRDVPPLPGYDALRTAATPDSPRETLTEVARWLDVCPPWGQTFDRGAEVDLAVGATGEIIAFQLQPGEVGVLRYFGNQTRVLADLEHVHFTLQRDGMGISGYVDLCGMKGDGAQRADELLVPLLPGQRISVKATNNSGLAVKDVGARIKGWTWNPTMEPRA